MELHCALVESGCLYINIPLAQFAKSKAGFGVAGLGPIQKLVLPAVATTATIDYAAPRLPPAAPGCPIPSLSMHFP